jgi:2-haloacid dehalogenase
MVKTVFLDLDDTILDFHQAEVSALRRTLQEAGVDSSDAVLGRYHVINKQHWEMLEEGTITRAQVKTLRFEKLFGELGVQREIGAICASYEANLSQGAFFVPGAEELLKIISPRYDLYLASNGGARVQNARLDAAGIRKYFKGQFISEEIGANKPDPAYFAFCFDAIPGFEAEKAVIVGDSLTSDIRGGRNVGLRTIWFNPQGKPPREDIPADYEIRTLEELPALLEKL